MRIFMVILILSCSPEVLWVIVDYDAILHNGFMGADVFTKLVEVVSLLLNWVGGYKSTRALPNRLGVPDSVAIYLAPCYWLKATQTY